MNPKKFTLHAHVGLDWKNHAERHASIHLVGPDGYAYACQNVAQFADDPAPRLRVAYVSPNLDNLRPGWRKAFARLILRAYRKSTPVKF
jgi:hypothetical protein